MDDEDGFRTTPPARYNPLLSFARANVALLVPIIGALIFAVRCVIVSGGDPYVASMLVTTTSVGDAIRALLFTVAPILLLISSCVAVFAAARQIVCGEGLLKALGMGVTAVALSLGYLYLRVGPTGRDVLLLFTVFAFASLVAWILQDMQRAKQRWTQEVPRDEVIRRVKGYWMVAGFPVAVLGVAVLWSVVTQLGDKTFWLPREGLDFQNEDAFTGYVLKESGDYLVILKDRPRVIIERKKGTLDDRDFCHPRPTDGEQVSEKVQSNTPVCP